MDIYSSMFPVHVFFLDHHTIKCNRQTRPRRINADLATGFEFEKSDIEKIFFKGNMALSQKTIKYIVHGSFLAYKVMCIYEKYKNIIHCRFVKFYYHTNQYELYFKITLFIGYQVELQRNFIEMDVVVSQACDFVSIEN